MEWGDWGAMKGMMMGCGGKGGKGKGGKGGKGGKDGGKSKGKVAMKVMWGEPINVGTIRAFNPEKKSGYITCHEVMGMCGSEVYVFQNVIEKCGAGVGDLVVFFLHWSQKGQPQCSSPVLRLSAKNGYALTGTFKHAKAAEGSEEASGYGFIECPEAKEYFGRDIYVHSEKAQGLVPGMQVAVNVTVGKDWKPIANALEPCDPSWEPTPANLEEGGEDWEADGGPCPPWMMMKGKGKGCGKGCGKGGGKGGGKMDMKGMGMKGMGMKGMGKKRPPQKTGETMVGAVKSYNAQNNWGFIDCEEARAKWGHDVWISGNNFQDPSLQQVGSVVQFEIVLNQEGKPQAANCRGPGTESHAPEARAAAAGGAAQQWSAPAQQQQQQWAAPAQQQQQEQQQWPAQEQQQWSAQAQQPMLKRPRTAGAVAPGGGMNDDVAAAISSMGFDASSFA